MILALVLLVVIALDGYAMFTAFMQARELALGAAQTAAATLDGTGNEVEAQKQATDYVATHGGELTDLAHGKSFARWYRAEVRVVPQTFVFQFVPLVNRFLEQESEASYAF